MLNNTFALKGTFCYSKDFTESLIIRENAYLICNNGISEGIYEELPACFQGIQVIDHTNRLINSRAYRSASSCPSVYIQGNRYGSGTA